MPSMGRTWLYVLGITGKGAEGYHIDRFQMALSQCEGKRLGFQPNSRPRRVSERTGIEGADGLVQEKALCSSQTPTQNAPGPPHG